MSEIKDLLDKKDARIAELEKALQTIADLDQTNCFAAGTSVAIETTCERMRKIAKGVIKESEKPCQET